MKITCLFVCTLIVTARIHGRGFPEKHIFKLGYFNQRKMRATSVVDAFLQTARVIYSWKGVTIYSKPGTYRQAVADFLELEPRDIDQYSSLMWGKVGDRRVSVQLIHDRPVLYLWKQNTQGDGSTQLIMDKIQYF